MIDFFKNQKEKEEVQLPKLWLTAEITKAERESINKITKTKKGSGQMSWQMVSPSKALAILEKTENLDQEKAEAAKKAKAEKAETAKKAK